MYEGDVLCASNTESGEILPPNGTLEVDCYIEIPDRYKFDKQVITAQGQDNSGFEIKVSMTLSWTWETGFISSKCTY